MNDTPLLNVEDKVWVVVAVNRSDSNACQIFDIYSVNKFLDDNNPILNPDGSGWGQWEVVSVPMNVEDATKFCERWMQLDSFPV